MTVHQMPILQISLDIPLCSTQLTHSQTELQNQGKQLTLCEVPAHIRVKGNEEADKAAKQAIDIYQG